MDGRNFVRFSNELVPVIGGAKGGGKGGGKGGKYDLHCGKHSCEGSESIGEKQHLIE